VITVTVTPDGGEPYELTATARDVLNWEKTSRDKTVVDLLTGFNMVDLYRVSHLAASRQQLFTGSLKEFEETCEVEFQEEDQEPEPDPTQPVPYTGPSSPSPSAPASAPARGRTKASRQS
jgi:hypothetical protein